MENDEHSKNDEQESPKSNESAISVRKVAGHVRTLSATIHPAMIDPQRPHPKKGLAPNTTQQHKASKNTHWHTRAPSSSSPAPTRPPPSCPCSRTDTRSRATFARSYARAPSPADHSVGSNRSKKKRRQTTNPNKNKKFSH